MTHREEAPPSGAARVAWRFGWRLLAWGIAAFLVGAGAVYVATSGLALVAFVVLAGMAFRSGWNAAPRVWPRRTRGFAAISFTLIVSLLAATGFYGYVWILVSGADCDPG